MFAVLQTGGKQYRVCEGDFIKVERLALDKGSQVTLYQILMLGDKDKVVVGKPVIQGASVSATILDQDKTRTILVFKKRRRKHFRRKKGHRQNFTVLRIDQIEKSSLRS